MLSLVSTHDQDGVTGCTKKRAPRRLAHYFEIFNKTVSTIDPRRISTIYPVHMDIPCSWTIKSWYEVCLMIRQAKPNSRHGSRIAPSKVPLIVDPLVPEDYAKVYIGQFSRQRKHAVNIPLHLFLS